VHIEKRRLVNEVSLSENVSRRDSKNKIQIHKKRRKVVFDDANEDDDDDVHILTSAALKASSCFESFLLLFFLFFFFFSIVLRSSSSSSSSSSRGCWCFSLVVSLLFRRVFTIASQSFTQKVVLYYSERRKEPLKNSLFFLSFSLSLETRARMRVRSVWVKQSPKTRNSPNSKNPGLCNLGFNHLGCFSRTLNLNISYTAVNSTLRHINTRREALINNCIYERRGGGAQKKGVSLVSRAAGKGVFFFFARVLVCCTFNIIII